LSEESFLPATWEEISDHYGEFLNTKFASATWCIADILQYVANAVQHLPTEEELNEFASMAASQLQDDMVSRGWDSISTLVDIWHGDWYCEICNDRLENKRDVSNKFLAKCRRCQNINWFTMTINQRRLAFQLIQKHCYWVRDDVAKYKIMPDKDIEREYGERYTEDVDPIYPDWYDGLREESIDTNDQYIQCGHKSCRADLILSDPWDYNAYDKVLDHIFTHEHEKVEDHPLIFGNT
jgi:hypothetical protein